MSNPSSSIRSALRRRILQDVMVKTVKKHGVNNTAVLVLDDKTAKIVSSCLRVTDLIDNGILAIESLHRTREPLLTYPAIYFLSTTPQSVELLIKDFTKTKEKPHYQMYRSAHVFFTTALTDQLMDMIENSDLVNFMGTLQEINIDFTTVENHVFSIGSPSRLPVYYWGQRELLEYRLKADSFKLVSLFLTLNDCPAVRYDSSSKLSTKFAQLFYKDLSSIRKNSGWEPNTRGCVLVVDRAIDLITPLMHEYTYQSLTADLCGSNNGEIFYINNETFPSSVSEEEAEKKQLILNEEEDEIWKQYRHQHIGIVAQELSTELKAFKKNNKMAQWEDKKVKHGSDLQLAPKDMAAALRDFAEYTKLVSKFSRHMELTRECLSKIDSRKLKEISGLEQDITTGFDSEGEKIDRAQCIKELKSICLNRNVGIEEKLRLVLIFLITQGELSQSVIDQLISSNGNVDSNVKPALYNIDKILTEGKIFGNKSYKGPSYSSVRKREGDARSEKIQFLRYVPLLWELGHLFVLNKLSEEKFKYCDPTTRFNPQLAYGSGGGAGKGKRSKAAQAAANSENAINTKPYMCIFVLGGITRAEMKAVQEIVDEHMSVNLIIGGSEILTPRGFLANLANVTQEAWVEYCGPSALSGARLQGAQAPLVTSTFDPKSYKKQLIDLENDEIAKVEGKAITLDKKGNDDSQDKEKDKKKKKPTRFSGGNDSDDDDIPELDF